MISTIWNLLYVFCRNSYASATVVINNVKDTVKQACSTSIYNIPGTTSENALRDFAKAILSDEVIKTKYKPDLTLFIDTLKNLLDAQALEGFKKQKHCPEKTMQLYLEKITGRDNSITVVFEKFPIPLSTGWPKYCFIIKDTIVKKEVTLAFGKRRSWPAYRNYQY